MRSNITKGVLYGEARKDEAEERWAIEENRVVG